MADEGEVRGVAAGRSGRASVLVFGVPRHVREALGALLAAGNVNAVWRDDADDIAHLSPTAQCHVALVGLTSPLAEAAALVTIRQLRQLGFDVVGLADDSDRWTIAERCQALLAGALQCFDPSNPRFGDELLARVRHLMADAQQRRAEDDRIRTMKRAAGLEGESDAVHDIFRWILRVGPLSDLPTLVTGETGTGKEVIARAIAQLDPKRRHRPLVAVNCAAVSTGLAESEFFGHRRGAFTGADRERPGFIRAAHGGVLFLDEVGELADVLQGKLLRVLQDGRVTAVGDEREIEVDVRIIAATNRNLEALVAEGRFRADLYHRLNVLSVRVPPLRDRPADIKPLLLHFLRKYDALSDGPVSVTADLVLALTQLPLPGNARELENIVRRVLVAKRDREPLSLSDLPVDYWRQLAERGVLPAMARTRSEELLPSSPAGPQMPTGKGDAVRLLEDHQWSLARALDYCEHELVHAALMRSGGNHSRTARLLGITPRSVYNKVRKHGLAG